MVLKLKSGSSASASAAAAATAAAASASLGPMYPARVSNHAFTMLFAFNILFFLPLGALAPPAEAAVRARLGPYWAELYMLDVPALKCLLAAVSDAALACVLTLHGPSYGGRGDISRVQKTPAGQALVETFSPF